MQRTINSPVAFEGVALHTGGPSRIVVRPARPDAGIRFRRIDPEGAGTVIPALWRHAQPAALCTRLGLPGGASVSMVEHLMAALAGLGINNALVDVDGPELPILDGSAAPFVQRLLACGLAVQRAPLRAIRLRHAVEVSDDSGAWARLEPAAALRISFAISFRAAAIGDQALALDMANGSFVRELARARTFCRLSDVDSMRAAGLARGGSLENAVVVDDARVLTPGGLRWSDEPVRHKMLDALGDLALAGQPLLAHYVGHRGGHALTGRLLRRLFETPAAWDEVVLGPEDLARLPGVGVRPEDYRASA